MTAKIEPLNVRLEAVKNPDFIQNMDHLYASMNELGQQQNSVSTKFNGKISANEHDDLYGDIVYKQNDTNGEMARTPTHQEQDRLALAQVNQQQLAGREEEIAFGVEGYSRTMDNAVQVLSTKRQVNQTLQLDDVREDVLAELSELSADEIPDITPSSKDFAKAFMQHSSQTDSNSSSEPKKKPLKTTPPSIRPASNDASSTTYRMEQDEVVDLSLDLDIQQRILGLSEFIDKKTGSPEALTRDIEKRIQTIGSLIDKKNSESRTTTNATPAIPKPIAIPQSSRVQKLRHKFGKR